MSIRIQGRPWHVLLVVALALSVGCETRSSEQLKRRSDGEANSVDNDFVDLASIKKGMQIVVRTEFSDDAAWSEMRKVIPKFLDFQFLDDKSLEGFDWNALEEKLSDVSDSKLLFIADRKTFTEREKTLLVVDLTSTPRKFLRCLPIGIFPIHSSISFKTLTFDDFLDAAQADGVFRGFTR